MFLLIIKSGASVVRPGIYSAHRLNVFFFFLFYIILHFFLCLDIFFLQRSPVSYRGRWFIWNRWNTGDTAFRADLLSELPIQASWAYSTITGSSASEPSLSGDSICEAILSYQSNSAPVILPARGECMAPFCKQYWRLNPGSLTWKARALPPSCIPNSHICTFEVSFPKTPSTHH